MVRATGNGAVLAESDQTTVVDGNHYFPSSAVASGCLDTSEKTSVCPWKGAAGHCDITVGDAVNRDAAWFYPQPKPATGSAPTPAMRSSWPRRASASLTPSRAAHGGPSPSWPSPSCARPSSSRPPCSRSRGGFPFGATGAVAVVVLSHIMRRRERRRDADA